MRGVDSSIANLFSAELGETELRGTDLNGADLSCANLYNADLTGALLDSAEGVANDKLAEQPSTLEGATMPNSQQYEDWLKSKGGGEDGENSGPS